MGFRVCYIELQVNVMLKGNLDPSTQFFFISYSYLISFSFPVHVSICNSDRLQVALLFVRA